MITCKDCLTAVNHYLDGELSEADVAHVRDHLEACPPCQHLFAFERTWRQVVRTRCRTQQAPEGLRERILSALVFERVRVRRRRPGPADE